MKKHFLTGLALLLPAVLTIIIVAFLVNLLTDPFLSSIEGFLTYYQNSPTSTNDLTQSTALVFAIRLFILFVIFLFILFIRFLTRSLLMYSILSMADRTIHRIPLINKVYKTIQDVTQTLFSSKSSSFRQVVLVPYPHENSLTLGFITSETIMSTDLEISEKIPVFVAGAPNPTFGFILMFPKEKVKYIDMKVDAAFKLLVSCGIMLPIPGNLNEK